MPCMKWKKTLLTCLTVIFCAAFAGCACRTEIKVLTPPESLLAECPEPTPPSGMTEGSDVRAYAIAVTRYNIDLRQRLSECNADKRAARQWAARMREPRND